MRQKLKNSKIIIKGQNIKNKTKIILNIQEKIHAIQILKIIVSQKI